MARTIFGLGAQGELIKNVQQALSDTGFYANQVDGQYDQNTATAVNGFRAKHALADTGVLDDQAWPLLMNAPVPSASRLALQLTAAFESHGFGLAMGNFDGALLTWGIIGFTLVSGEVSKIIQAVHTGDATLVPKAFGEHANELLQLMQAPLPAQKTWAQANTHMPGGALAEPWKTMFATFGSFPAVQQEQIKHVQQDYMAQAIQTARALELKSELALALCFDIHVQDGGVNRSAMASIAQHRTATMGEAQLLPIIANAVAGAANPNYAADVLARKLTIATGHGTVHGRTYILDNWGLRVDIPAPELAA